MRKLFSLIFLLSLLCFTVIAQAATVTGARWGQQPNDGLRFVVDVSADCKYEVKLDGNSLQLIVDAEPANGVAKSYIIGRKLADSMQVNKVGDKTVLKINLKQSIAKEEYKCFALKQPTRIVMDVMPKPAQSSAKSWVPTNTYPIPVKVQPPVVSNQPQKSANNGTTWTPANSSSSGSWTDRFHKNDKDQDKPALTPTQRVKQSIEEAKQKQAGAVEAAKPQTTVPTASTQPIVKPAAETLKPQSSTQVGTAVTTSDANSQAAKEKIAQQQGSLKKILTAKQNARREAAAEAESKKKIIKNKNGSTTRVEDGITYIKGNGKFDVSGGLKDKVIALDPGHGGSDPGAIGAGGTQEKNITLPIAKNLRDLLTKAGAKVYMTRTSDTDVDNPSASDKAELQARVNVAEKNNADVFISIHINSAANKSIGGLASYYYPKTKHDARLAKAIQNKLSTNFGLENLGIREANFYVNKRSSMPSTLLELGFISNPKEETVLKSKWFQEKAARVVFEGLKDYFK